MKLQMRPSGTPSDDKSLVFMEMAHTISRLSTCNRKKVGCVITNSQGFVIAVGYNGAPSGFPHCEDEGCQLDPDTGQCVNSIHAEINAIVTTAKMGGSSLNQGVAYTTTRPCVRCTVALIQAGIQTIVYDEEYESDSEQLFTSFCEKGRVNVYKLHVGCGSGSSE